MSLDKDLGLPGKSMRKKKVVSTPEPDTVTFVSANKEPGLFKIMGVRPYRPNGTDRLYWDLSKAQAERFVRHFFFVSGRIIHGK